MARTLNRLSATKVAKLTKPGRHADGGGLYLKITSGRNGGKRWVFMYQRPGDGKRCEMGLGGFASVSLARAREKSAAARELLAEGIDPREAKDAAKVVPTFGELAEQYIADNEQAWGNQAHRQQWRTTLRQYAQPLWNMPVDQITTNDVLGVLKPLWQRIPTTASRLRGRIAKVLDAAKVRGHRSGENPAAWVGHLALILPAPPKVVRRHPAMPIDDVPIFLMKLRAREGVSPRCLEFVVLTLVRTGEARGARWDEIDFRDAVWTVPAERMKGRKEHRVPLSGRVIELLREMELLNDGSSYIFPGQRRGRPLSRDALRQVLGRMGITDATVHGYRSSARDFFGERTNYPRDLAEMCIAHIVGNAVEQAYRRGNALERRRPMMEAWASFCETGTGANVVPFQTTSNNSRG